MRVLGRFGIIDSILRPHVPSKQTPSERLPRSARNRLGHRHLRKESKDVMICPLDRVEDRLDVTVRQVVMKEIVHGVHEYYSGRGPVQRSLNEVRLHLAVDWLEPRKGPPILVGA